MLCCSILMEQKPHEMSRIVYPCAACKIQRKKCGDKCLLAPYFPPNETNKFLLVNKLFGTSKIVKILKEIPVEKRSDVVNSLVYEASARVVDPIYGCTGAICLLERQVLDLQSQLAIKQAELLNTQANLVSLMTSFYNCGEAGPTLAIIPDLGHRNDDFIVLQDDMDLFEWKDMACSF